MLGQLSMIGTRRLNRHYQSQGRRGSTFEFYNFIRQLNSTTFASKKVKIKTFSSYFRRVELDFYIPEGTSGIMFICSGVTIYSRLDRANNRYDIVLSSYIYDEKNKETKGDEVVLFSTNVREEHIDKYVTLRTIPQGRYTIDVSFLPDVKHYYNMFHTKPSPKFYSGNIYNSTKYVDTIDGYFKAVFYEKQPNVRRENI